MLLVTKTAWVIMVWIIGQIFVGPSTTTAPAGNGVPIYSTQSWPTQTACYQAAAASGIVSGPEINVACEEFPVKQ